jgi:cytokinin riboside 5'-monophosphate phosphoribohydrolase
MGELARSVIRVSSRGPDAVIGFIPARLSDREVSGNLLGRTKVVNDMHERKAAMSEAAEAFIALPGGCAALGHVQTF